MSRAKKILAAARTNPVGVAFTDLQKLVEAAGWAFVHTNGSHHKYAREGVPEIIDIQPAKGGKDAKAYQVRQVLGLIEKYGIVIE